VCLFESVAARRQPDRDDVPSHPSQMLEIALLVQLTLVGNELRQRLAVTRPLQPVVHNLERERGQMPAGEVACQIGWREAQRPVPRKVHHRQVSDMGADWGEDLRRIP
jgi:hypothetical protein